MMKEIRLTHSKDLKEIHLECQEMVLVMKIPLEETKIPLEETKIHLEEVVEVEILLEVVDKTSEVEVDKTSEEAGEVDKTLEEVEEVDKTLEEVEEILLEEVVEVEVEDLQAHFVDSKKVKKNLKIKLVKVKQK